eukprot:660245-Hanusia_phi.AAC.1
MDWEDWLWSQDGKRRVSGVAKGEVGKRGEEGQGGSASVWQPGNIQPRFCHQVTAVSVKPRDRGQHGSYSAAGSSIRTGRRSRDYADRP